MQSSPALGFLAPLFDSVDGLRNAEQLQDVLRARKAVAKEEAKAEEEVKADKKADELPQKKRRGRPPKTKPE